MPHEFAVAGIFMPPLLVASVLGIIASTLTARALNRYRLSRYVYAPPLVQLCLAVFYTVVIGTFLIKV